MKIAVASDHRGYAVKEHIKDMLHQEGHVVEDFGCASSESCDYPKTGLPAAEAVARGDCDMGLLLCGTGIGMSIVANKVKGVLAALVHDELTAALARKHNGANILCLPADLVGEELIRRIVHVWLKTGFEGGRHERRVKEITDYEGRGAGSA
jgi:ribose 5-phosphate isomerase B